jgi:hypothetical protein
MSIFIGKSVRQKARGRTVGSNPTPSVSLVNGHEVYRYSNRLSSGWSWDRADYNVVCKKDRA